jgi:signal transduction histidine kinase
MYGAGAFVVGRARTPEDAILWWRLAHIGIIFIPITFFHYVYLFLEIKRPKIVALVYALGFLFLGLDLFTPLLIAHTRFVFNSFYYNSPPAPLYPYFLSLWLISLVYSYRLLYRALATTSGTKRIQIIYFFSATFLGFAGGVTSFLPIFQYDVYPYLNFTVAFFPIIMTYAVINYHLMDIRLVARKYLVYSTYIATIGAFFILTKLIFSLFIPRGFENLVDLSLLVIAILFTSPIKGFYYRIANKYFFSSLYDSSKLIAEISEGLRSTIELDKIFALINHSLKKTLHLKAFAVMIYSATDQTYLIGYNDGFDTGKRTVFPYDKYLHKYYTKTNLPIVIEELRRENNPECAKTVELLRSLGVELLIPLNIKNETIGLLALGKKEAGDIYNDEDLSVLKVISSQAAVAIDNAKLYDEVSKFNETLQEKVDAQTKDIQAKAEHLKKLMDMRSEFLDITSHQLRTPVSVIKGVLSMLEEGSIPPARVKEFIRGAMEKAIKLGEIINDILRASEMDTDKFTMTVRPVDLNEMLEKIKEDKRRTAEMRNIAMVYEFPANIPLVLTDPKYVEHAIVNLINNSLQYTVEGSITTSVEVTKTHVIVRVSDTGIGIPPEALPKLFGKFARAENAVTTFTDGTGLGLFIIKQIVDANPGAKIEVERTEVGKGTTFALWLPIATDPKAAPIKTSAK